MSENPSKNVALSIAAVLLSVSIALCFGEVVVRLKNSSMKNYDIEMWRYAKELKNRSDIAVLGHEHIPSKCATLQSVEICTDSNGLRGVEDSRSEPDNRRILFLGSSVTLGWGVPESETLTSVLQSKFPPSERVKVFNAGIGNYNAVRYVTRFKERLTTLNPTDIVVHYFVRDAETLDAGGGNFLLQHSELAVMSWIAASRFLWKSSDRSLEEHYQDVYKPDAPGFIEMNKALHELAEYGHDHGIRIYLAMIPDVHDLKNYKLGFIHEKIRAIANTEGYEFIDLYPAMKGLTPEMLWAMPGDPHPNALGHKVMAEAIYPLLLVSQQKK